MLPNVEGTSSSLTTPRDQNATQMKFLQIDKKTKDMLLKTFVDRIVERMVGKCPSGYHARSRFFTITDESQKEPIRSAVLSILRELGPTFGLQGALVPSEKMISQRQVDHSSIRLTNELKTEVMHSAALILRSQLKNSKPSEGVQSLRRVVNMNDGILRKMLDPRSTQKTS